MMRVSMRAGLWWSPNPLMVPECLAVVGTSGVVVAESGGVFLFVWWCMDVLVQWFGSIVEMDYYG